MKVVASCNYQRHNEVYNYKKFTVVGQVTFLATPTSWPDPF